jgi:hypothetical protein
MIGGLATPRQVMAPNEWGGRVGPSRADEWGALSFEQEVEAMHDGEF